MAGTIIADTIQATSQQISLNVGNTTILTASSTGLTLIPTTNVNINVTNSIVNLTSGNVSRPGLTFSGNTSTGLYMPLANTVAWTTAGTENMRITNTGQVGIGTTNPSNFGGTNLEVANTNIASVVWTNGTYIGQLLASASSDVTVGSRSNHPLRFATNDTERMRIDANGNLQLKGTGGTSTFNVFGNTTLTDTLQIFNNPTSTAQGILFRNTFNVGPSIFSTGVATTNSFISWVGGNGAQGSINGNGAGISYGSNSDYRLKENVVSLTGALNKVALLKPVNFKWKADGSDSDGFIAHELAEVFPYAVHGEKDAVDKEGNPEYQNVDTSFLVATLTAAIQELKVIVDAQAVEIAALKAK